MAEWISPIFDRTAENVAFAKEQIQKWKDARSPNKSYPLKGCLNLYDMNRIEGNIQYISDILDSLYYLTGATCKTWAKSGMPTEPDARRILNNLQRIESVYRQPKGVPNIPDSMATYSDINSIEENLYHIKLLIDTMIGCFQKSGTFQSGAMRMLPIRR